MNRLLLAILLLLPSAGWATTTALGTAYSLQTFDETELTTLDTATTVASSADNARLAVFSATVNNPNARSCNVTLTMHRDDSQVATKTFTAASGNSTFQLIQEDTGLAVGSRNYEAFVSATCLPMTFTTDTQLEVVGYDTVAGAGVDNFTELDDTPSSYTSAGSKLVKVNSGADALEFVTDDKADTAGLTTNRLAKASDANTLADSLLSDDGTNTSVSSGALIIQDGAVGTPSLRGSDADSGYYFATSGQNLRVAVNGALVGQFQGGGVSMQLAGGIGFGTVGSADVFIDRDGAANTLRVVNGTSAQRFSVYETNTDASNYERYSLITGSDILAITAETAGTGSDNLSINLVPAGSGTVQISGNLALSAGNLTLTGDVTTSSGLATTIGNDKVLEAHLKAVDAAGDEECLTYETTTGDFEWQACGGGGGSSIVLDLADDGSDESSGVTEIATTGDTNSIFTESADDKLLIAVGNDWPKADTADDLTCTNCIGGTEIDESTLTITAAKPFHTFTAPQAFLPASNYATQDTRNTHPVLDFDATTDECAYFGGVLSNRYAGGGLTVTLFWSATSATTGGVSWLAAIEAHPDDTLDLDSDSFASNKSSGSVTAASASGELSYDAITFSSGAEMDSLAAGESYRLRVCRNADGATPTETDDMTGDAELHKVTIRES